MSGNTRVFLTGRPHIEAEIIKCFTKVARIPLSPTQDDIKSYLEMKLNYVTNPYPMHDELRADIKIKTQHAGPNVGLAYKATIICRRVMPCSGGRNRIHLLQYSEYPHYANTTGMLARACHGRELTIYSQLGTVSLVHYTLQESLTCNSNLFLKPHAMISEVCLNHLKLPQVRSISPTLRLTPPTVPFVEYSSCHWATHVRRETTEHVQMPVSNLLDAYDGNISSKVTLWSEMSMGGRPCNRESYPSGFTRL